MKKLIILFSVVSFFLYGCEGFKFISIQNKSNDPVTLTIHPGIESLQEWKQKYFFQKDTVLIIPGDSTILIPTYFGMLLFRQKIKEEDIKINYLQIVGTKDTIIAQSKREVFLLLEKKGNTGVITIE